MKNLNVTPIDPSEAVSTPNPQPSIVFTQAQRIDRLIAIIRGLTERTADAIKDDVLQELSRISQLSFDDAAYAVRQTYTQAFFRNEPDVDYKVALCHAILEHMRRMNPNYENPLLENIANRSSHVAELITPLWK